MIWDKGKSKEIVTLDILVSKLKLKTVRYIRACPGLGSMSGCIDTFQQIFINLNIFSSKL